MEKLRYIKHKDIDFEKWDKTVLQSEWPLVFAQSFYLNSTANNWDALSIGDYECVFPITKKSKLGINYLPQPHFTSQLGAFGKVNLNNEKLLYEYILNKFRLIEIELNAANKLQSDYIKAKHTFIIKYNEDFQFNQNTRRNISKAIKEGLNVVECPVSELDENFTVYILPLLKNKLKLPATAIEVYKKLVQSALKQRKLISFKVIDKEGNTKAFAHFISNGKHVLYLKGSNAGAGVSDGSMHLLLSYAIEYFKRKADFFDFGGGSLSEGLADFYRGLGGKKLSYSFLQVNNLPSIIKTFKSGKSDKN